jgi:hypothetical protein
MRTGWAALLMGVFLTAAPPAFAHHAFAAEFDASKPVTLKGAVTKIEWMNPHIWVYVDAKDENAKVSQWQCEGGAPAALQRRGWSKTSLKPGDEVAIEGFRAKDGTNTCNARSVKLPDGKSVFAGSADDAGPGSGK